HQVASSVPYTTLLRSEQACLVGNAEQSSWHIHQSPVSFSFDAGRAWRRKEKGRKRAALFFGFPFVQLTRVRVTARRKKNDAHHRARKITRLNSSHEWI